MELTYVDSPNALREMQEQADKWKTNTDFPYKYHTYAGDNTTAMCFSASTLQ